jgi:hypothetical protein
VFPRVAAAVPIRIPLEPPAAPYLRDHRFNGRPVLPAVEAMELLAAGVAAEAPSIDRLQIREARFDKFLPLDNAAAISLWCELETEDDGVVAALRSKRRGKHGIARRLTHAEMRFGGADAGPGRVAKQGAGSTDAPLPPSPERIYTDLVPFGASYRNLSAITRFEREGIRAKIAAPAIKGPFHLGSPFVLDAAFHAACVWGQRYAGVVAFPVGFDRRRILRPCEAGRSYETTIRVRDETPPLLIFDIAIDNRGEICEVVTGVRMRDVSGGRLKPPNWISAGADSGAGV